MVSAALDARQARAWVDGFVTAIETNHAELGELDRRIGDGDFGTNLRSAARRMTEKLVAAPATAGAPFAAASDAFLATGGTSGPLLGMWFRALAQAGGDADAVALTDLAAAVADGAAAIGRLGGAQVGDKTMLDAFVPASEALSAAAAEGADTAAALQRAAAAATAGAEATVELEARRGRSSYVGDAARGVPDPGARAVALLFDCGVRAVAPAPTSKETHA
jgi:dihydroxyacetone kinase-like protein